MVFIAILRDVATGLVLFTGGTLYDLRIFQRLDASVAIFNNQYCFPSGFPEHMPFGEFRRRFDILAASQFRNKGPVLDEKKVRAQASISYFYKYHLYTFNVK